MTDKQLKSFITIAECRSFSTAEGMLFLSKQALKKQIDALEQEIGTPLFIRSTRGLMPTAAGKEFLVGAKNILALIKSEAERCRAVSATDTLRIPADQDSTNTFIAGTIPHFSSKYAAYSISRVAVEGQDWLKAVKDGALSLCLYADSPEVGRLGLSYSQIRYEAVYCLMDKTDPLSKRQRVDLRELMGRRVYIGNRNWYSDIIASIDKSGVELELLDIQSSYSGIVQACTSGGICLYSEWRIEHFKPLVARVLDIESGFSLGIVHGSEPSQMILRFIEMARELFGNLNPPDPHRTG